MQERFASFPTFALRECNVSDSLGPDEPGQGQAGRAGDRGRGQTGDRVRGQTGDRVRPETSQGG